MSFEHMFVVRAYVRMFVFAIFCDKKIRETSTETKSLSVKWGYRFGKNMFGNLISEKCFARRYPSGKPWLIMDIHV